MNSTTRGTSASWRAAVPVLCAASFLLPARADAACGKAEKDKIENFKKAGIAEYDDLDMEAAKSSFKKALTVANKAGCVHKSVAKIHIRLGVIYKVADLDDGLAIGAFKKALELDPEAELDRDVSTPEVESVLKKARAGMAKAPPPDDPDDDPPPDPDPPPVKTKPAKAIDEKNLACFAMREGAASACVDPELELKVQCESSADLGAATLNYRVDAGPWVPNEMVGAGGFFGTTVSGASIRGKKIEFYVDATDAKAKRVAWAGTSESPYGVKIGCKKVVVSDDPPPDDPKPKKTKGDSGSGGDGDVSLDEEDPLGDGEEDDDDDDVKKPKKDKGPGKPLGRLFSFYLNFGTGLGLSTAGGWTQLNHAMVQSGTMWAPLHTEPEIAFHLPLGGPIGVSVGAYGRLQLSPIFAWQVGLRGRVFKPLSDKISLVFNLAFAFGPTCKTAAGIATSGCRGGVAYLIPTPEYSENPLDYVLAGPFAASLGIGLQIDFNRFVGFYGGIDLGGAFGGTGFDNLGNPIEFAFQPHLDVHLGLRFGN